MIGHGYRKGEHMADFVHPEFLVETEWLSRHLNDPAVVVLDCTVHLIPNPATTYDVSRGGRILRRATFRARSSSTCPGMFPTRRRNCASCARRRRISPRPCGASALATIRA